MANKVKNRKGREEDNSDSGRIDDFVIKDQSMLRQKSEPISTLRLRSGRVWRARRVRAGLFLLFFFLWPR